jgi:Secretion system C-terminal sorting domain/FG-GAP-like repeat
MNSTKFNFNTLFIQYNRYVLKLNKLLGKGSNVRKQNILEKKIKKLQIKLQIFNYPVNKKILIGSMAAAICIFQPKVIFSQNFSAVQTNPFSLIDIGESSNCSFTDLDSDGDFDMISGNYNGNFLYFENIGTATNPNFDVAQQNPFSLTSNTEYWSYPIFIDLDNDADFDILTGSFSGTFYYYKNIGNANSPVFDEVLTNPFSLNYVGYNSAPTFFDLDGDGDFDMISGELYGDFYYFENTGNSNFPNFAEATINTFSLTNASLSNTPTLIDFDGDNDADMVTGNSDANFVYYQNIGTNLQPEFTLPLINPNGLTSIGEFSSPSFVDLDGDQDLDLATGHLDGNFYYFEKNCSTLSPMINNLGNGLSALQENATYQWIDCNNSNLPIAGETDQTFVALTSGNYAAEISLNGCNITSDCYDVTVCEGNSISTNLNVNGYTLTAEESGAIYQWIDCNSGLPIEDETSQNFTALESGNYAVEITVDNCTSNTECIGVTIVGMEEITYSKEIKLFPNPINNNVNVILEQSITKGTVLITAVNGQKIKEFANISGDSFVLDLSDINTGLYFLEIKTATENFRSKILKK